MSEFKFACPVCGQHITADSSASGSQLDCPTCFRKIVVPNAPSSRESKFVLAASEATRPRPTEIAAAPAGGSASSSKEIRPRRNLVPIYVGIAVGLIGLASGAFFFLGHKTASNSDSNSHSNAAQTIGASARRVPSGTVHWTLDLASVEFPAETAFGRIRGADFVCDRAVLQGGTLNLRMNKDWPPDLGLSVYLYARQAEDLSGKSALVNTNNIRSPRVVLRWKEGTENRTKTFTNGYAMKVDFGAAKGNRLPGKIYICLPDPEKSCVAGVFNAEIRRPSNPSQPPAQSQPRPKPKPGNSL